MTLDQLYEAISNRGTQGGAPTPVCVDTQFGLVAVDVDTLWHQLHDYERRHGCPRTTPRAFRFERVTSDEVARDGVCPHAQVVRLECNANEIEGRGNACRPRDREDAAHRDRMFEVGLGRIWEVAAELEAGEVAADTILTRRAQRRDREDAAIREAWFDAGLGGKWLKAAEAAEAEAEAEAAEAEAQRRDRRPPVPVREIVAIREAWEIIHSRRSRTGLGRTWEEAGHRVFVINEITEDECNANVRPERDEISALQKAQTAAKNGHWADAMKALKPFSNRWRKDPDMGGDFGQLNYLADEAAYDDSGAYSEAALALLDKMTAAFKSGYPSAEENN